MRKETEAKKRFEYMTGETTATRFFNGTNSMNVNRGLNTFDKMMYSSIPEGIGNKKSPIVDDYNSGGSNRNGS